nr:DNA repair protein recA homolog 1, chloroplastic [Ipomoea batatas]
MSLISQLTSHYFYSKLDYYHHSPSPSCAPSVQRRTEVCSLPRRYSAKAKPRIRVRSEFDAKINGLLPSDSDPRFIDRQKALEAAMNDINSSFGKGSVTRLGSAGGALVETFPSGILTLDFALGGGIPKGRIVEIYGPESSGKTTLALHAIAEVQKLGGNAMLVDAEHAFDPAYSKALGVDVENLIVCQPDNGEMALESKCFPNFGSSFLINEWYILLNYKLFYCLSCRSHV